MNLKDGLFLALGAGWTRLSGASILMYHSIEDRSDHFNSVAPTMFQEQMEYLASRRYDVVALSELVRRLRTGVSLDGSVVLTFDDGYRNNYTHAFPILKKHRFPATIFVVTGQISGVNEKSGSEYLRENELKEMEASGLVDIEPHTVTHPKLGKLAPDAALEEMKKSKEVIELVLGKRARYFAYPYGNYTEGTARLAKESGFEAAVTVHEGTVHAGSDLLQLPRNSIDSSTTFIQFKGKVSAGIDRYEALKRLI